MTSLTPEEEDQIVNGIERMRPSIEAPSPAQRLETVKTIFRLAQFNVRKAYRQICIAREELEAISLLLASGKTDKGARDTRELIVETNENWGLHDE